MGVTSFTMSLIAPFVRDTRSVIDLGAQNNYAQPNLPAPYMREWWEAQGVKYDSIDLSGECGAIVHDLTLPYNKLFEDPYDLVIDAGTSEHCGRTKSDLYQVWLNKWELCKEGGFIISENPATGNWPGHGRHYLGKYFYTAMTNYLANGKLIDTGLHPAMGNTTDGWNVWGIIQKRAGNFMAFEKFEKLPVFSS